MYLKFQSLNNKLFTNQIKIYFAIIFQIVIRKCKETYQIVEINLYINEQHLWTLFNEHNKNAVKLYMEQNEHFLDMLFDLFLDAI